MAITDSDRATLRDAWHRFCDTLHAEGERVLAGDVGDAADAMELAEALRCAARIGAMSLQHRLDFDDPDFPLFFRSLDDRFKYGGPDVHITYFHASVDGDKTYRIRGSHGGREVNVNTKDMLWNPDIAKEADGSFEVILGAEPRDGNWARLDPAHRAHGPVPDHFPMAAGGVTLRTYYWDRSDDEPLGWFTIERIDEGRPDAPEPLSPERLARQLHSAAELVAKAPAWWIDRAANVRAERGTNTLSAPSQVPPGLSQFPFALGGPLNYGVCAWDLGPDDALYIETELPECAYWSFQLHNPWWESPDNQNRQTSIGHAQAFLDDDGRFRAVVSHRDPGVPNWLDAAHSRRGFVFYRWFRPTSEMPTPACTLIDVAAVRHHLPAGHPHVDAAQRASQLAARRARLARRFQR